MCLTAIEQHYNSDDIINTATYTPVQHQLYMLQKHAAAKE